MRMSKENYEKFMKGIAYIVENANDEQITNLMNLIAEYAKFMAENNGKK